MTIDKTKRDEAVFLLNRIHGVNRGFSRIDIQEFIDTLLSAIVPEDPTAPEPDINDQVSVPDMWLARDEDGKWFLLRSREHERPRIGEVCWHCHAHEAATSTLDIPWRESLHKAVNGKWVRWNPVTNQPLEA